MILELEELTHRYGTESALEDVSFGLEAGELVAVLGPSGCGKTTLVQAIAGHVSPTAGRIRLRGEDVTDAPPEARHVGLVFQESTLYPHMTVGENVAYGLAARDVEPGRRDEIVTDYLELVDLSEQREAYPGELSGGQRRRVELARALAPQPDLLLLDEPLSALDRTLRERLRGEVARIQRETGVTTLFVTHDQEEAMALADRLVVMNDGSVSAVGTPRSLYESPPTPFVASFLGRSNALSATVVGCDPLTVAVDTQELRLEGVDADVSEADPVTCHVRPDDLSLSPPEAADPDTSVPAEVVRVADVGRRYEATIRLETGEQLVVERTTNPPNTGDEVAVEVPAQSVTVFCANDGDRVVSPASTKP
ncbi:ABC transporter ATP-binding protein [Natrialbaceae archaeon AArc-T1-2]|uniref:ABC transporter ATP-binding protein n=1 Tax=Natrialbaceae archaeon AArc-T1-2 TaxID=3053904 RepID=UPI00255A880A|nr:ABC transporter ATP-binding protein [Natrialbaceae archaeon AArc-T1-2]WIV66293.1 ABC transporter ATP-binding protein [Natrialbaceae archaeon AArc-T1-2]